MLSHMVSTQVETDIMNKQGLRMPLIHPRFRSFELHTQVETVQSREILNAFGRFSLIIRIIKMK